MMMLFSSADLVAQPFTHDRNKSILYGSAPQSWSRRAAELVALFLVRPQSWSRVTADLVAPYIEQNTAEHSFQNIFQNFRTGSVS